MARNDPVLRQQVFEARYARGYQYLDRCGAVMLGLEKQLHELTGHLWLPSEAVPTGARIECPAMDLRIVFDSDHLVVEFMPLPETISPDFQVVCTEVLATVQGRLAIEEMRRFGARWYTWLGVDSVEAAEKLSVEKVHVDSHWWRDQNGMEAREHSHVSRFELPDRSKGVRISVGPVWTPGTEVTIDPRLRLPPHWLPVGQPEALLDRLRRQKKRGMDPQAGLQIDVDYYHVSPLVPLSEFLREANAVHDAVQAAYLGRT